MARHPVRSVVMLVAGVAVIAGAAWAIKRGTADEPVSFRTVRLDRGSVEQSVTATGSVSAVVTVQVGSQVSGVIAKLGADFNSKVKEGQVIAQIDPTRFKAALDQAHASLKAAVAAEAGAGVAIRQAKLDLDRAQALVSKQVLGVAELDSARTKFDQANADHAGAVAKVAQARAAVGAARVDMERTTIRTPISGTVLQRSVDVGQTVAASLQAPVLFTIAQDLARMEVHAAIDEADVGKLHEGQEAAFTVDAYPGESFRATIFQIRSQPTVVQNVVTYDAVVRFDNPDSKIRPGMTATVRVISLRRENVLRVPNAALRFKPASELVLPGADGGGRGGASGGASLARGGSGVAIEPVGGAARPGAAPATAAGGGGTREASGRTGGGRTRGRVYKPAGNKVTAVTFRPGISDEEFTEIAGGDLKEGDELVVDVSGGGAAKAGGAASSPVGGGSRRAPRMF